MESVELLKLINESLSDQGLVVHYEINENGYGYYMFPVEWPMDDKESGNVCHWSLPPSHVEILRWVFDSLVSWKLHYPNEINK